MLTILICWAIAGVMGWLVGLAIKNAQAVPEEKEDGAAVALHDLMVEAFRRINPNSRGIFSRDLLNLSTAIQKLEAGEDVPAGVCIFLLEKVGAGDLAEKAKGAGA